MLFQYGDILYIKNAKLRSITPDIESLVHYEVLVTTDSTVNKLTGATEDGANHTRTFLPLRQLQEAAINTIVNVKAEIAHLGKVLTKTSQNGNSYSSQVVILSDGAKNKVCLSETKIILIFPLLNACKNYYFM